MSGQERKECKKGDQMECVIWGSYRTSLNSGFLSTNRNNSKGYREYQMQNACETLCMMLGIQ